jgi:hypothetical protein
MIKYGTLTYNFESDRYSVRIAEDNRERHIDLHCGDPLAVFMNEEWKDTRIEMNMAEEWYFVGLGCDPKLGSRIKLY